MNNRRAKLMAGATVLGLGALGGVAVGTNPGTSAVQKLAANGSVAVVTSTSGATATQPAALTAGTGTARAPIVTRASGGPVELDD